MKKLLFLLLLLSSLRTDAQKLYGIVFNENGELLPFSSLTVKGTTIGSSANNKARFSLNLAPGNYTLVCQHIGYAAVEKTIVMGREDQELTFVLKNQNLSLQEVKVNTTGEDPAVAIIRQTIRKRPEYQKAVNAFTCELYTKDLLKLRKLPEKIFGRKIPEQDKKDMRLDSAGAGIIYLSESISTIASAQPDKFKMEVKSSRVSGSGSFGFTFPTFISFYNNNVTIFTQSINPRGFVSPIADNAFNFYRFKFLGSFWENGKEINSIRVIPKRDYEPLFSGTINITEGDWRIHSTDLMLTKKSQLELLDSLQIIQFHVPAAPDIWRVKNQWLHLSFKQFGIDAVGNFVNVYSDYSINKPFPKGYFDNVVIKYDTGVNKKPKAYWDTVRPVPLEKEEMKDYLVKDSLYEVTKDSVFTQADIDSLKKAQGKLNPMHWFWKGIDRNRYSTTNPYRWGIDPLIPRLEYNTAEGLVVNVGGYYRKRLGKTGRRLAVEPHLRYGINNGHLNGWIDVQYRHRGLDEDGSSKRTDWNFSAGTRVSQFNKQSTITPLVNSFSTLLYGHNYLKNYENIFGEIGYTNRFDNGMTLKVNMLYEDRIPLDNTTNFTFFRKDTIRLTPNYPWEKLPNQFERHQAFVVQAELVFKPGQQFIQFPSRKIAIGSKYPTFILGYAKGIPNLLGSDTRFDKWYFTVTNSTNLRLGGLLRWKASVGGFLNDRNVFIQDFQHFNGNLTAFAGEYLNSFQVASYYENSTTASFYTLAHLEHHFNGLLTNKIPLFRKLNWHLVAGGNTFYVNRSSNHIEIFAGIENILKILRVDVVMAYASNREPVTVLRIGAGGLLGSSLRPGGQGGGLSVKF